MRMPQLATRFVMFIAAPLLLAGVAGAVTPVAGAVTPVAAAAARAGSPGPAASFATYGDLLGVAATSAGSAWAVGYVGNSATLILHWNGTAWKQVPSPSPRAAQLSGVAATSGSNAWAVGFIFNSTGYKTLIEHWNGTRWTKVPSPSPGPLPELSGVAATSASNAWAVGNTGSTTLMLRWNGTAWK